MCADLVSWLSTIMSISRAVATVVVSDDKLQCVADGVVVDLLVLPRTQPDGQCLSRFKARYILPVFTGSVDRHPYEFTAAVHGCQNVDREHGP